MEWLGSDKNNNKYDFEEVKLDLYNEGIDIKNNYNTNIENNIVNTINNLETH